jgi:hypothetical protein
LLKKSLKGGGERRARLLQFVVARTQLLVRSQTRQEGVSTDFVEFIVDQRDKFGVIVGHEMVAQALLFQFGQRRSSRRQPAHNRADRDAERGGRLGVTIPFPVNQQDRLALRLREPVNGS